MSASLLKVIAVSLLLVLFLMAISIGCFYARPNAEVLSIMADIKCSGLSSAAERMLLNYDGRYFTNLLHGMNPVAYGNLESYQLMPLAAIAFFLLAIFFWLKTFLAASFKQTALAALLLIFVHFAVSPDITSELFNLIAVYVYLYGICFWLIWTAAAFRLYSVNEPQQKMIWFIVAAFALFASTGTNEQILLLNFATIFGGGILIGNYSKLKPLLPLVLLGIFCALFFVSCPGWRYRVLIEQHTEIQSSSNIFLNGVVAYFQNIKHLFFDSFLLFPISLLITAAIIPPIKNISVNYSKILLWCGLLLSAGFAGAFIYLIGVENNSIPPGRIYCVNNALLQLCAVIAVVYFPNKFQFGKTKIALAISVFCLAAVFGKNNYTGIINEYRAGTYSKFETVYQKRLVAVCRAQSQKHGWRKVCFEDDELAKNLLYYPVEILPNRMAANISYEKFFGIDEVCFCSDTIHKADLFLKGIP